MKKKGKLIIFEGGDGTGKTTHCSRLKEFLCHRGLDPLHIREPGSTPLGEEVRKILIGAKKDHEVEISPEAEMLLYMASRAQLFKSLIVPELNKGRLLILERSFFSTYAYQGMGLGLDPEMILSLGHFVCSGAEPSRVILLDLNVEKSLSRLGPGRDRVESRSLEFHERVRSGYLDLARRYPELIRIVDADGALEEVEGRIHAELSDLF